MRILDLIFIVALLFIFWIILSDKCREQELKHKQQEVVNVIRPENR